MHARRRDLRDLRRLARVPRVLIARPGRAPLVPLRSLRSPPPRLPLASGSPSAPASSARSSQPSWHELVTLASSSVPRRARGCGHARTTAADKPPSSWSRCSRPRRAARDRLAARARGPRHLGGSAAARAAARAAAVGADPAAAARGHLPRRLERGLRVRERDGGEVAVSTGSPRLPPLHLGRAHATASFPANDAPGSHRGRSPPDLPVRRPAGAAMAARPPSTSPPGARRGFDRAQATVDPARRGAMASVAVRPPPDLPA